MGVMGDWLPWILLAAAAIGVTWAAQEVRAAARWMRRAMGGGGASARPRGWLLDFLAMGPALARAEQESAELAALRREHERLLGELLGNLTQAVLVVDGRGRLRLANPAARALLGMESAELGSPFVPLARSAALVDFVEGVRRTGVRSEDVVLNREPARDIRIRVSGAPTDPEAYGAGAVILVAEDVTQLRRLQAVEREFIANASHDLRTPVTILRGYAETLQQDHATMSEEDRRRFIGKLVDATQRLSRLLEGLLALASLESGIRLEPVRGALAAAAEDTLAALADRMAEAGVTTRLEIVDREGSADPTQARRMVQNLCENALGHARGMTLLLIRVRGHRLEVEDDGAGVGPADLERLFDRFYRVDRSRRQGGSGLGLSIVRQVAELHGGSAWAEPAKPRGLRVVAVLGNA